MATRPSQSVSDSVAEPRSIDLRDSLTILRRRWMIVLALTILGAVLAVGYTVHKGKEYAATAQVIVQPASQGPLQPSAQPNLVVNMATEQAVAESAPVAQLAAKTIAKTWNTKTAVAVARGKLNSHLTVTVPLQSNLLQITWRAGSPEAARLGADAFASAYLAYRHSLLSGEINQLTATLNGQVTKLQAQIKSTSAKLGSLRSGTPAHQSLEITLAALSSRLSTASQTLSTLPTFDVSGGTFIPAATPLVPSGLSRSVIATLGLLLGLMAGVAGAFVREALDDGVRDPGMLESKLGAPTLAVVRSRKRRSGQQDLAIVAGPATAAADNYRTLRTMLTSVGAGGGLSSIVVVGVDASVSSSQVAAELGVALAESGRRTLLVAGDIVGSSLWQIFGQPETSAGLTNVVVGNVDPAPLTQRPKSAGDIPLPPPIAAHLTLFPAGPPIVQPLSVLDSVAMGRFLKSMHGKFDFVVLDASPASAADDYLGLARMADGVVVVAGEASSGRAIQAMRRQLDQIGGYVAGGVFVSRKPSPRGSDVARGRATPQISSSSAAELTYAEGSRHRADRTSIPSTQESGDALEDPPGIESAAREAAAADQIQRLARWQS